MYQRYSGGLDPYYTLYGSRPLPPIDRKNVKYRYVNGKEGQVRGLDP